MLFIISALFSFTISFINTINVDNDKMIKITDSTAKAIELNVYIDSKNIELMIVKIRNKIVMALIITDCINPANILL